MEKELTIVISTYNSGKREPYLRNTLDSVFNQTAKKDVYDVLVVNDGSTDNTQDILDEYSKKYDNLILHKNETNMSKGGIPSFNVGFSLVKTKYLMALSDDNELFPTFIEDILKFTKDGNLDYAHAFWTKGQNIRNPQNDDNRGVPHIVKTSIIREIGGFDEEFCIWSADKNFWYEMKNYYPSLKIGLLNKVLARYYDRGDEEFHTASTLERRKLIWTFFQKWQLRESRYFEEPDPIIDKNTISEIKEKLGISRNQYELCWLLELFHTGRYKNIYSNTLIIKNKDDFYFNGTYDSIVALSIFNTLNKKEQMIKLQKCIDSLQHNGVLIVTLLVDKKGNNVDINEYFKKINSNGMIYYPSDNFRYRTRERGLPIKDKYGNRLFRLFVIKGVNE